MEGTVVGNYRVVRKLSEGGMGAVYEAVHSQLGKRAVLKALRPEFAHRSEFVQRLFDEARAVNLIEHPGLVDVFDCGQLPDATAYILMEFLRGEPLGQRLKRGPIDLGTTVRIGRQIASALAATHEKGIIHRDLKPDNIMIIADPETVAGERTKILDFGIAKVRADLADSEDTRHQTQTGTLMGTPLYMSPEQCRGAGHVDERTDVYSLGVILYRMLAGRPPFMADGAGEVMLMHMSEPPPPLGKEAPSAPPELVELVHWMLAKSRDSRPSMREVAERLQAIGSALLPQLAETQLRLDGPTRRLPLLATLEGIFTPTVRASASSPVRGLSEVGGFGTRWRAALLVAVLLLLAPALWLWLRRPTPLPSAPPVSQPAPVPTAAAPAPPAPPSPPTAPVEKPANKPGRGEKKHKAGVPQFPAGFFRREKLPVDLTKLPEWE